VTRLNWWPAGVWPRREPSQSAREIGYEAYVDELSQRLYRQTHNDGGWAVDVGVYGPGLFKTDAQRLVHEIALGSAGELPSP
jgi:hypothetical protein